MKPDRISYQKVFPLSPYVNEKIGVEIQLDEGDSPQDALIQAKALVETFHKMSNPQLEYGEMQPIYTNGEAQPTISGPISNRIEALIQDILKETALRNENGVGGLLSWKLLADKNPELKKAYDKRLNELSQ